MTRIAPRQIIRTVTNKRGEEIIEMFDKNGKINKWFNPSQNISAEISRPSPYNYESFISDENKSIYSTKEVDKYGGGVCKSTNKKTRLI